MKLDELICAIEHADDRLVGIEECEAAELDLLRREKTSVSVTGGVSTPIDRDQATTEHETDA